MMRFINLLVLFCWLCTQSFIAVSQTTQSPLQNPSPHLPRKKDNAEIKREALEAQRRAFGVSIIISLTAEAAGYKDLALRARVFARAADALWDADPDTARILFRRAWEAAEKADWTDDVGPADSSAPAMLIALPRRGEGDSRAEVLNLAARRDRTLGDELLAKLMVAETKVTRQATDQTPRAVNDSWTTSDATSKRLSFAHRLLDENEPEKALEFAAPALEQVSEKTISFLSRLRLVKPALADKHFLSLLARAELEPSADANTVSGLSSYAFTPGQYLNFGGDGSVRWIPALETIAPPNLPPEVRSRFFRTAANILLRPLPPPDQDLTSAGLIGKYMVIKRLLPLFEQYAPVTAVALHSQINALEEQALKSNVDPEDFLLNVGLGREEADPRTVLDKLQERIDRAKDERQRDEIYADAAAILAAQGNPAAQDVADKIDNVYRREMARRYVDVSLVRAAVSRKDAAAAMRFAKSDTLTHPQRTWAYLQIAQLLKNSDRTRTVELLEEALAEARRIDTDDANRPQLMIGVATQLLRVDQVRSWEVAAEAIKAANAVEAFSGEANNLSVALFTSSGFKLVDLDTSSLNLSALVRSLAKQDLVRATDLAKSLKYEAPRALAILAAASAAMEKAKQALHEKLPKLLACEAGLTRFLSSQVDESIRL